MKHRFPLFHILGVFVVGTWLTLMGYLIYQTEFRPEETEPGGDVVSLPIHNPEKEWREIYLKGEKVGYTVGMIQPFKEGYFLQDELFLKLNLMGLGKTLYALTQAQVDERLHLRGFQVMMSSGAVRFRMSGRVEDKTLVLMVGGRGKKEIELSQPLMLGSSIPQFFRGRRLKVGEVFIFPFFDPSTLTQKKMVFRVAGKETLVLHRTPYEAFRVEAEGWGRPIFFWIDEKGETLKEEGLMGLTVVKSSAARASQEFEGGSDLYEMSAVMPDRVLNESARLSYLKMEVEGLDPAESLLNTGRQKFKKGTLEIQKEKIPSPSSFCSRARHESQLEGRQFLEPEVNIESRHKEIVEKARQIAENDPDPISVARKMLTWVYRHVEKKPVLSIPSALEVLHTGAGDCNEHAVLLTALFRAAGIPSRLSAGLVYSRDKFYYHAWTEAYLGDWISMDATMDQMPVDASHIKLVEGNLDKQVHLAAMIGEIKIRILDWRYD